MAYTTINKSTDYFNTKLYTGNGSAGHSITGVGFQPDWVWIKQRDIAENNETYDAVRGVTKAIFTDSTSAEVTQSAGLASFNSDGFTVGNRDNVNKNFRYIRIMELESRNNWFWNYNWFRYRQSIFLFCKYNWRIFNSKICR